MTAGAASIILLARLAFKSSLKPLTTISFAINTIAFLLATFVLISAIKMKTKGVKWYMRWKVIETVCVPILGIAASSEINDLS